MRNLHLVILLVSMYGTSFSQNYNPYEDDAYYGSNRPNTAYEYERNQNPYDDRWNSSQYESNCQPNRYHQSRRPIVVSRPIIINPIVVAPPVYNSFCRPVVYHPIPRRAIYGYRHHRFSRGWR